MPLLSIRRRCLTLSLATLLSACAGAPPAAPDATLLAQRIAPDYNGVVLVRARRGAIPLLQAYGQARFEAPAPVLPDTRFMIGSVSKWITTVAVLRLVEQGKLALDKPVTTWLPELTAASRAVTLRALLSNTSGLENGLALAMKRDRSPAALGISPLEGALKFGSGPVTFAPGSSFDYSVTNWLLVGGIVERATSQSRPQRYVCHVAHANGRVVASHHNRSLEILDTLDEAESTHHVLDGVDLHGARPDIKVRVSNGVGDLA